MLVQIEVQRGGERLRHYGMAIMLAIAYGSNVGGIGTKIGTAPNAQFAGFLERLRSGGEVGLVAHEARKQQRAVERLCDREQCVQPVVVQRDDEHGAIRHARHRQVE